MLFDYFVILCLVLKHSLNACLNGKTITCTVSPILKQYIYYVQEAPHQIQSTPIEEL